MKRSILVCTIAFLASCSPSEPVDQITGAYAREYSFEQKNIQSGKVLGLATIRDTFYLSYKEGVYEVIERKWRKNDYDLDGWKELKHSSDRERPPYTVTYNATDNTLTATGNLFPPMALDLEAGSLLLSKGGKNPYQKIRH